MHLTWFTGVSILTHSIEFGLTVLIEEVQLTGEHENSALDAST